MLAFSVLQKCVKPGGLVTIALPNIESFQSTLFRGNWFHLDPPRHLTFLARLALVDRMNENNFSVISEKNFSFEYDPFGWQQSFLNMLGGKRDALYEVLKSNPKNG